MISCLACKHSNRANRLWCEHCNSSLPLRAPLTTASEGRSDTERSRLYHQVLADLDQLRTRDELQASNVDSIQSFYQDRLTELELQAAQRAKQKRRWQQIAEARTAAHKGRFEHAIRLFSLCTDDQWGEESQSDYQVEQSVAEIRQKQEELRAALQLKPAATQVEPPSDTAEEEILTAVLVEEPTATFEQTVASEPVASEAIAPERLAETTSARFEQAPPAEVNAIHRLVEATSNWSAVIRPFLIDNVGWFVGAFLVVAGFVVLIVTFWSNIEQNRILMHSLVFGSLSVATATFFSVAYFMRLKYPQLENSSNVLLTIVALLIPLVFAAAMLTSLIPAAEVVAELAVAELAESSVP